MNTIKLYGNSLGNDIQNEKGGNKIWYINPKYIVSFSKMISQSEYTPCTAVIVVGINRALYVRETEEEILSMLEDRPPSK